MAHLTSISKSLGVLSLAGFLGSCSDLGHGFEQQSRRPIISEPVHAFLAANDNRAMSGAGEVYVSLAPLRIPAGNRARLRNRMAPQDATDIPLIDGGFDPVRVLAEVGDTLELTISDDAGTLETVLLVVPAKRRPGVVRTIPPRSKTDVPLNTKVTVVFSEPIDRSSLGSENMQLRRGAQSVAGQVLLSVDGLVAEFLPARQLDPQVQYTLVVSDRVKDLSGDFLEETVEVPFTTASASVLDDPPTDLAAARLVFAKATEGPATQRRSHLYSMNGDGSDQRQLTNGPHDDLWPAVSPDGTRIAFSRDGDIYVMNVDGADIRRLTTEGGRDPAWSPDGTRIVFVGQPNGLYIVTADGGRVSRLTPSSPTDDSFLEPAWSPDGNQIAFTRVEWDLDGVNTFTCVWIINADGTGETRLGRREVHDTGPGYALHSSWSPVWSADGERIALVSPTDIRFGELGPFESGLFVVNRDGFGAVLLARQPVSGIPVLGDWSEDEKWIAYEVESSGFADIYAVTAAGKTVRITNDGRSRTPAFLR